MKSSLSTNKTFRILYQDENLVAINKPSGFHVHPPESFAEKVPRHKIILNLGTAGSHRFQTHSLIECKAFLQRDMDLSPLGFPAGETPMDEIKGRIEVPTWMSLPAGVCGTGDRFEVGPPKLDCDLVDMEAYAIAKVCKKLGVGLTALKYITDGSDDQAHKDWYENLKPASRKLFEAYEQLMLGL